VDKGRDAMKNHIIAYNFSGAQGLKGDTGSSGKTVSYIIIRGFEHNSKMAAYTQLNQI
jgi:hypothetical protein